VGSVWMDLVRPLPPTGGACTVAPTTGTALATAFSFTCTGWVGSTPPLQYSFSAVLAGPAGNATRATNDGDWMWTPAVPAAAQFLYLPVGNYSLWARIEDSDGTATTVQLAELQVYATQVPGDASALLAAIDQRLGQLARLGQVTQLLTLAHSVALDLEDQALRASVAAVRGRRRVLAQSSLQYRLQVA
jgi:hypothetical protein